MDLSIMFTWVVEEGFYWFVYIVSFAVSVYLLITLLSEPFDMYIRDFRYRVQRVKEKQNNDLFDDEMDDKDTINDGAMKEIAKKLHATRKVDKNTGLLKPPKSLQNFFIESGAYGSVGLIITFIASTQVVLSFAIGCLFVMIPYMVLVVKVNNISKKVGDDFLKFVQVFTQQYNANSKDIMAALRATLRNMDSPEMRVMITRLISEINQTREERGVRRAVNELVYVTGSSWAKRLGSIIVRGYIDQYDVGEQLGFLEKQVMETEEMIEKESAVVKDVAAEAFIMPFLLIGSLALGWYTTKIHGFWELQFGNTIPLMLMLFSCIGTFFGVMIGILVTNTKNDI